MSKKNAIFYSCNERFNFNLYVAQLRLKKYNQELLKNTDVLVYYQDFTQADTDFLNRILPCKFTEYQQH